MFFRAPLCYTQFLIYIGVVITTSVVHAEGPKIKVKVAPEFTVTRQGMGKKDPRRPGPRKLSLDLEAWAMKAQKLCETWPGCKRVIINDLRYSVINRFEYFRLVFDDTWISVTSDPGVHEIKMPFTDLDLWDDERQVDRAQKFAFDIPASLKHPLKPSSRRGMGHISYEMESLFHGKLFRLRQLYGDRYNNPQLAMGIHENDDLNANAFAGRDPDFQLGFVIMLWKIEDGEFEDVKEFFSYSQSMGLFLSNHTHEVELKMLTDDGVARVEERAMRAQNEAAEFPLLAKLTPARLDYFDDKPSVPIRHYRKGVRSLSRAQRVALYKEYVEECGMKFSDYVRFIPKDWLRDHEVLALIRGQLDGRTLFDKDSWEPFSEYAIRVREDLFNTWVHDDYVGTPIYKKALFSTTFAKRVVNTARELLDFYDVKKFKGPESKDLNRFAALQFVANVTAIKEVFLKLNPNDVEKMEFDKFKTSAEALLKSHASVDLNCVQQLGGGATIN